MENQPAEKELQKCSCENVTPLLKWFEQEDPNPDVCRSCYLPKLASFYIGVLEEKGETTQVEKLKGVWEQGEILTIAETMDTIKASVEEPLRNALKELDCEVQSIPRELPDTQ